MRRTLLKVAIAAVVAAMPFAARADIIGGIDFPQGPASFADAVVAYAPGLVGVNPSVPHRGDFNALGVPDYTGVNSCPSQAGCSFVSLGDGGSITLRFIDNRLTGSGTNADDIHIFEVGPDVEDTFVEISQDGFTWHAVGKVFGATAGIDIDAFGWGTGDLFEYVRLTDDTNEGGQSGATVGADIDAVGAISTVRVPVPEPGTLALLGLALVGWVASRRRW